MSPILLSSPIHLPPNGEAAPLPHPRYEIGAWFVTIYYVSSEQDAEDAARVEAVACALRGSLGKRAPMFLNQHHPTIPLELAAGSSHPGLLEEMHAAPPEYGHFHVELIGAQRNTGFVALGVMDVLKRQLEMFESDLDRQTSAVECGAGARG